MAIKDYLRVSSSARFAWLVYLLAGILFFVLTNVFLTFIILIPSGCNRYGSYMMLPSLDGETLQAGGTTTNCELINWISSIIGLVVPVITLILLLLFVFQIIVNTVRLFSKNRKA